MAPGRPSSPASMLRLRFRSKQKPGCGVSEDDGGEGEEAAEVPVDEDVHAEEERDDHHQQPRREDQDAAVPRHAQYGSCNIYVQCGWGANAGHRVTLVTPRTPSFRATATNPSCPQEREVPLTSANRSSRPRKTPRASSAYPSICTASASDGVRRDRLTEPDPEPLRPPVAYPWAAEGAVEPGRPAEAVAPSARRRLRRRLLVVASASAAVSCAHAGVVVWCVLCAAV